MPLTVKSITPQLVVESLQVEPSGSTAADVLAAVRTQRADTRLPHTILCSNGRVLSDRDTVASADNLLVLNVLQLAVAAALAAARGDPARAAGLLVRRITRQPSARVQELGRAVRAAAG